MKVKDYLVGLFIVASFAFSLIELVMAITENHALSAGIFGASTGVWFASFLVWSVNAVIKKMEA